MSMQDGQGAATAPVSTITIQGLPFEVDRPYVAGSHELTAGEAHALNQTRAENLRNNFASVVRKAMDEYRKANSLAEDAEVPVTELDKEALDEAFANYVSEYEFALGGGGGPRTPVDPVLREAQSIALKKVKEALSAKAIKISSVSKERMAEFVSAVIAKYPSIMDEAKRRVETVSSIAIEGLGA
jgi:hypothetical protein